MTKLLKSIVVRPTGYRRPDEDPLKPYETVGMLEITATGKHNYEQELCAELVFRETTCFPANPDPVFERYLKEQLVKKLHNEIYRDVCEDLIQFHRQLADNEYTLRSDLADLTRIIRDLNQ